MKRYLTLLTLPALLTGCTVQGGATVSRPSANATGTPATGTGTAATGTRPGGTGSTAQAGAAASLRCHTADLSLTIGTGDGAAGATIENLVFTNKSGRTCTLYGFPGVSWMASEDGGQVNDPFVRDSGAARLVTLAPRGVAHASLATHDTGLFPAAKCKPVQVRGLRIFPPDEKDAVFVDAPQTVCSGKGVDLGLVKPIASGPSDT